MSRVSLEPTALGAARADYDRARALAKGVAYDPTLRRGAAHASLAFFHALLNHDRIYDALDLAREMVEDAERVPSEAFPRHCAVEACLALVGRFARGDALDLAHEIAETIAHFAFSHARHGELQIMLADAGLLLVDGYAARGAVEEARAVTLSLRALSEAGTAGSALFQRRIRAVMRLLALEIAQGAAEQADALRRELADLGIEAPDGAGAQPEAASA